MIQFALFTGGILLLFVGAVVGLSLAAIFTLRHFSKPSKDSQ